MPRHIPQKTSIVLESHQVILRPLITEKNMSRSERYNAYAFEINRLATKLDVRRAVEELFEVKVLDVRTQNRKGKTRRFRTGTGHTRPWKKAIVKLHPDHRIDYF